VVWCFVLKEDYEDECHVLIGRHIVCVCLALCSVFSVWMCVINALVLNSMFTSSNNLHILYGPVEEKNNKIFNVFLVVS